MTVTVHPADAAFMTPNGVWIILDPKNPNCRASQTTPRLDLLVDDDEPFAADIEFQRCREKGIDKWTLRMGRIAVVNSKGQVIYDVYVHYPHNNPNLETAMDPKRFGVERKDLKFENGAKSIHEVRKHLEKILTGRRVIVHGGSNDRKVLEADLNFDFTLIDTQDFYGGRGLSIYAAEILQKTIQRDPNDPSKELHGPCEDARTAMELYLLKAPYKGRTGLTDTFKLVDDDFPSLGATDPRPSAAGSSAGNASPAGTSSTSDAISQTSYSPSTTATTPGSTHSGSPMPRPKGKKNVWSKFSL